LVVLTSDHGEEFWDHGGFEHGHSHYAEVLEVPLLFRGSLPPGTRSDVASLIDIAPTVLASLGIDAPGMDGRDLHAPGSPALLRAANGNLYAGPSASARRGNLRAIVGVAEFDVIADPLERTPLPPGELTTMARAAATEVPVGGEAASAPVPLEALRALGYVE
jgi:arylsulfatase A-like enzyme